MASNKLIILALCFLSVSLIPIPQTTAFQLLFPQAQSTVLPDPKAHFSAKLLSSPLPTNSFFQNFVLKNGDQPEYLHPYAVNSSASSASLSLSYPSLSSTSDSIYQSFNPDLTISATQDSNSNNTHRRVISAFNDLSVNLEFPSSNLSFFLVRGSPYITCAVTSPTALTISTVHKILSVSASYSNTKFTIKLDNDQTWAIYTSSKTNLTETSPSSLPFREFSGIIRIALVPGSDPKSESILDRFRSCHPVSGEARLTGPFTLKYKWEKNGGCRGWGNLLMLAHPLHLHLLATEHVSILPGFKYKSIDGDLVGVVGDSWVLKSQPISLTWHSIEGLKEESQMEIISALQKDVEALNSSAVATNSSYFYGKLIARAARLALIAEEVEYRDAIPAVKKFLKDTIEPWLDGTFRGNGFLYDDKWGGLVTKQGSTDKGGDFGFGIYNDHHFHLGYFIYGISVLARIDLQWGMKYKAQAYSLTADFINRGKISNSNFPRMRCFDMYKLHSWAGGLTEFPDGRNQESSSEAVNAYYSAALLGLAYGDHTLVATASTLTAMEILAAQTWWHVKPSDGDDREIYAPEFANENRMVGIVWQAKRDSGLWFASRRAREIRVGIQVLPLSPITEVLFSDWEFAKEVVEWASPALSRDGAEDGWRGLVYSVQAIYDKNGALEKVRKLGGFDDGNSLSNMLWWVHSRSM